ncbi:MAG: alpha/beta hydrolase [Planctomycetes bacterium]|nr:alpha/beta hydrolase [Planctomycetota bacterium]
MLARQAMFGYASRPAAALLLAAVFTVAGCGGPTLVPTPNILVAAEDNPFANVAPEDQSSDVEMFYVTDRKPETAKDGSLRYGHLRSPSIGFGTLALSIGDGMSWDDLVAVSRTDKRKQKVPIEVTHVQERVRGPASNPPLVDVDGVRGEDPEVLAARQEAGKAIAGLLSARLERADRREIYLFVHGYNNTFDFAAYRMGQIWHFMGRVGVPMIYTWPAGHPDALRGYNYDRESGEFTIFHLRSALEFLAAAPDVEKIHIIAHSRGTDVAMSALRELHLQARGAGEDTREKFKIGHVILAAPDLDLEVLGQRVGAERLQLVPERLTIYLHPGDKAIGMAQWLFDSIARLGDLQGDMLTDKQKAGLKLMPELQMVDCELKTSFLGHAYFIDNPSVFSDLILVLRDDRDPGVENGRPLVHEESGFWTLWEGYPIGDPPAPKAVKEASKGRGGRSTWGS